MKNRSESSDSMADLREKLVGLGEYSIRKTYYPELQQRIEELRASEEFLRNIVDNIPAMVFVKDAAELSYRAFNKAGEELLGYTRDELLGKNDRDFFPEDQAAFFIRKDREVLASGQLVEIPEETVKTRHGGDRILRTKKIPLYDDTGMARFLLGISEDITERKLLEAQLLQSQKMEAVGHLASGVAHDFNNILMVIMGYGAILRGDQTLTEQQRYRVDQILDAAEKASQLTGNLLAFGRKQQIKPRLTDVNDLVRHIHKFLNRIIGEDVQLRTNVSPDALVACVDSGQIEQVLINLATNARDAMPKGGLLTISSESHTGPADSNAVLHPGRYALLSVTDTGTGMDEATRARIFEPFFTTKELGKGTGLGMSIVHGIVKQHHGLIDIITAPGAGTTFRIFLPLAEQQQAYPEAAAPQAPPRGNGEMVLIAEDDQVVASLMQEILGSYGYRTLLATDGHEAVTMFSHQPETVRLVVMDLVMPRLNGREAAAGIRNISPAVPILFTSGYALETIEDRNAAVEDGALLMKPVHPLELLRRVRELLDR